MTPSNDKAFLSSDFGLSLTGSQEVRLLTFKDFSSLDETATPNTDLE